MQLESFDRPLSADGSCSGERLWLEAGTVDLNGSDFGIYQPSELRTVGQPLAHLFPKHTDPVRLGSQLNNEIWADWPVSAESGRIEIFDAGLKNPGSVG